MNYKDVHCKAFYNRKKKWKYPKCPTVEKWLTKLWHIYTKRRVAIKNFIFSIIFQKFNDIQNFYYTIKC